MNTHTRCKVPKHRRVTMQNAHYCSNEHENSVRHMWMQPYHWPYTYTVLPLEKVHKQEQTKRKRESKKQANIQAVNWKARTQETSKHNKVYSNIVWSLKAHKTKQTKTRLWVYETVWCLSCHCGTFPLSHRLTIAICASCSSKCRNT